MTVAEPMQEQQDATEEEGRKRGLEGADKHTSSTSVSVSRGEGRTEKGGMSRSGGDLDTITRGGKAAREVQERARGAIRKQSRGDAANPTVTKCPAKSERPLSSQSPVGSMSMWL